MTNPSEWLDKARDLAGQHSEHVSGGIDRVEDLIDQRTGGQYADQVNQGGDFLENQLGIGQPAEGTPADGAPIEGEQPPPPEGQPG